MRICKQLLVILLLIATLLCHMAHRGEFNVPAGYPDWTRAVRLIGIDANGKPTTLLTDADGALIIPIQGADSEGDLQPVLVDSSGRIIMVAYGTIEVGGELDVNQTDSIREMQGLEGANLHTVAVDASGQIIMVPRGQSGYYMSVDDAGNLTTVLKGTEGSNLRPVVVDSLGNLVAVMKGLEGANLRTVTVDASGQIIMVPRGSTGNYMAIDSDGYMTAVLKGAYGAALRTIKLDDDGRITAYLADSEDQWGQTLEVGLAEQAARLGSPVSWDRRGKVLVAHTFEHGLAQFRALSSGTGAGVELSPDCWIAGGYSCKLTAGSDTDRYAALEAGLGKPPNLQLGLSARFSTHPYPTYFQLTFILYSGSTGYRATVRYDYDNDQLQYRDSAGNYQNAAAYKSEKTSWVMDSMKVVADFSTGKYVRLMFNGLQHNLTADVQSFAAAATGDFFLYNIRLGGHAAANDITYLDSVVVTVGEP